MAPTQWHVICPAKTAHLLPVDVDVGMAVVVLLCLIDCLRVHGGALEPLSCIKATQVLWGLLGRGKRFCRAFGGWSHASCCSYGDW